MKAGIHPEYVDAVIRCGCGNTWETRSTKADMRIEVCSQCHPFFTGEQRIVDTAGRVERFRRRYGLREEDVQLTPAADSSKVSAEEDAAEPEEATTES